MAETMRSELPNLWRSMNEPRACRHLYQICPQTKGRFKRPPCYARSSADVTERDRRRNFCLGTPLRSFTRTPPGGEVAPIPDLPSAGNASPQDRAIQATRASIHGRCAEAETSLIGKALFAVYQRETKAKSTF